MTNANTARPSPTRSREHDMQRKAWWGHGGKTRQQRGYEWGRVQTIGRRRQLTARSLILRCSKTRCQIVSFGEGGGINVFRAFMGHRLRTCPISLTQFFARALARARKK